MTCEHITHGTVCTHPATLHTRTCCLHWQIALCEQHAEASVRCVCGRSVGP